MSTPVQNCHDGFSAIIDAICHVEGDAFFESEKPSSHMGPPPEEDVDLLFNMANTLIVRYPYYAEQLQEHWFEAPSDKWFNDVYSDLKMKVKHSRINAMKLKQMENMQKIYKPIKWHRVGSINSLFRSFSYLLFGKEKHAEMLNEIISAYKKMMEINFNEKEIAENDSLRAFAKYFAINVLVYIEDNDVPRWRCYGPGEFGFVKFDDLINKEYKTSKYLEQKSGCPCLCLSLKQKRYKAITALSSK